MSADSDSETERKIVDFLRQNGKSTVLIIFKKFGLSRSTANRHLYNLERSKQVFKSDETPPFWDLMEKNEIKLTLKPEKKSPTTRDTRRDSRETRDSRDTRRDSRETRDSSEEIQEEHVRDLLKSGGLKAYKIAQSLGQPKKTLKKQLYIMEKEGKVQKCSTTSVWTLNDEESNGSYNQESSCSSDHRLGSNSGLSQSFDVITELGKGGFGCVYKVKHKFDGKIYAVKKVVLTGKADSEVKALARVEHPNIVRYITCWSDSENCPSDQVSNTSRSSSDVVTFDRSGCEENDDDDEDGGDDVSDDVTSGMESLVVTDSKMYLFIQMEFCEGGTLTTWINDRNFNDIKRTTMEIHQKFYEIISGVEYIHSNNLIHRDLKPDNILFGSDGQVKIGDFGLVVHQTNDSGDPIERSNRGTPPYMSPEQKNGRNYDEKTDIFPLGLVWFEMLWKISTGRERAKLWPDLRNQRFPDGFCDSYPTENKFIKEMLSCTPEDRPQAEHIKEKLEKFFSLDQNLKSEDARLSSNSPCETPSSSDQSTVSSPMVKRPTPSSLDAEPRIKLAPNFDLSPNRLAQSKENPAKPSGGQTSSQTKKSRFLEDFDSINPLGDGTFGLVFKARRKLENKYYAVKIVKSRTKACREVDALAHLNNANIVRYYSAWKEDTEYRHESSESNSFSDSSSGTGTGTGTEFLYIQMELCEGDTLRVWINDRNFSKESFPERRTDAARISRQVLTAVDYIHSKDLIHRDLKPPNIMFGSDGGVKVGDFGLVTAAENAALLQERTIDTGSPLYMAPEQVTQYYDTKVDIYALGLIYFELLWKLGTMTERNKIWSDLRNRNFPLEFSKKYNIEHSLIQRMLSASPKDRPDATELIRELDQYFTVLKADKDIQSF